MTIYTFPSRLWKLATVSFPVMPMSARTSASAFNPVSFTAAPTTELWTASASVVPQVEDDWRDMSAFLRKLRGPLNKVRLYDVSRRLRGAGALGGLAQIGADAVAGATTITIKSLIASEAIALAADDLIGIGENLHAISDDASSDSNGEATVSILPPLRSGVADGDQVKLTNPTGLFVLTSQPALTIRPGSISEPLQLEFMENPDFE